MCTAIIRLRSYNLIGLTGGIGCGKSTLSKQLQQKVDMKIIDCDLIAHELMQPGYMTYRLVVLFFGKDILDDTKKVDRKKLGQIIFNNKKKKQLLEIIT